MNSKLKRLFFDIETSPNIVYSWRVGYNITLDPSNIIKERAIICICYKWEDDNKVYAIKWNNGNDSKLVKDFYKVLLQADEIVGHNSDEYDIKWFKTRALYHGIETMPSIKSIDTLKLAKANFNFNSNKLDYISKLLGSKGKIKTDWSLWERVINNNKSALNDMIKYCANDVIELERIFKKLYAYSTHKTHVGVLKGNGKCSCGKCGSTNFKLSKTRISAAGVISKQLQCNDCGGYFTVSETIYNKYLESKL